MEKILKQKIDKYLNYCQHKIEKIILILTIVLIAIFPLIYRDYYFDILNFKAKFFCDTVIATAIILLISILIMWLYDYFVYDGLAYQKFKKDNKECGRKKIIIPDIALLCFLVIASISTILSDYKMDSFTGNEGRYTGLRLLMLYGLCYFIISKGLKFRRWILDLCLFAAMLACLFGITHYFHLDILGFKERINRSQYDMFISTFGNINTYTAYVGMIMALSTTLFATAKKQKYIVWYYICMIISFFALIMGVSDNAYLALAALFTFLPLYLFRSRRGIKRYAIILASFFSVIQCIDWIEQSYKGDTMPLDGVFKIIVGYSGLAYIVIVLWILVSVLYLIKGLKKEDDDYFGKKLSYIWLSLIIIIFMILLYMLYDVNVSGSDERYGVLTHYLRFDDEWGTHRGYIWRIAIENYKKFPLIQKIFGYGPDTFGIITTNNNYYEMTRRYNEVFDSTHNEYLQYLITIGPLGLLSYIWFLISAGLQMIKKDLNKPYTMAILFALVCYSAQAVVNINLPIATPIMWTLLMVGLAGSK